MVAGKSFIQHLLVASICPYYRFHRFHLLFPHQLHLLFSRQFHLLCLIDPICWASPIPSVDPSTSSVGSTASTPLLRFLGLVKIKSRLNIFFFFFFLKNFFFLLLKEGRVWRKSWWGLRRTEGKRWTRDSRKVIFSRVIHIVAGRRGQPGS